MVDEKTPKQGNYWVKKQANLETSWKETLK